MTVFMSCFSATFRRSSAKVMQRAVVRPSKSYIPKTACSTCRQASLSATTLSTNSPGIFAQRIRTLVIHRMALPRPFIMPVGSLGAPGRVVQIPTIRGWM